jgi:hypothetical protein
VATGFVLSPISALIRSNVVELYTNAKVLGLVGSVSFLDQGSPCKGTSSGVRRRNLAITRERCELSQVRRTLSGIVAISGRAIGRL